MNTVHSAVDNGYRTAMGELLVLYTRVDRRILKNAGMRRCCAGPGKEESS